MKTALPFARLAAVAAALLLPGCVSSKYKLAKVGTPSAITVNLPAIQPPLEAMLNTVIVYRSPGSWKREAYWDEYQLTLVNHDSASLTFESVFLVGIAGQPAAPGAARWLLEKTIRALAEKSFGVTKDVTVQLGSGLGATSLAAGVGAALGGSGWAALGGAALGVAVAVPAVVGVSIHRNVSGRHEIEREFARRRLVLPVIPAPGGTAQGSLFFPITPGPQRLAVRCHSGDDSFNVIIDLAPLASQQLKVPATAPTP